ncbi:hypothetical protein J7413_19670 [Shimia sp. R10_1]|uniref:hypothetical protein n=1 Tax=Shimia sp. R10_1 TaxID=2821095 RepID=UPI001ADBCDD1|nr:hypothetical protein [Shimia sp. R10_1]MBO9475761.1 hypothetical protein [Shimia sp. R10_1]
MTVIRFPNGSQDASQAAALGNTMSETTRFDVVVAEDGMQSIAVERDDQPHCGIHPHDGSWHIVAPDFSVLSVHRSVEEAVRTIAS